MSKGPTATALLKSKISIINNMTIAENFKPWLYKAKQYRLNSLAVFPLKFNDKPASINIYSSELDSFDDEEMELLARIVNNISNAIHSINTENEKRKASKLLEDKIKELKRSQNVRNMKLNVKL